MEQPFNKEEKTMHQLMQETELETPSAAFASNIMKKIDAKAAISTPAPLISMGGWFMLVALFAVSSVLLYLYPISGDSLVESFTTTTERVREIAPSIHVSKGTVYACFFLVLFLIQIPFLKRFLDNQRA